MAQQQQASGSYEVINLPLAATIGTRDANFNKDALLNNCYAEEAISEGSNVLTRFGYVATPAVPTTLGTGVGLYNTQWGTAVFGVVPTNTVTGSLSIYSTSNQPGAVTPIALLATVTNPYTGYPAPGTYPYTYPNTNSGITFEYNALRLYFTPVVSDALTYGGPSHRPAFTGEVLVKNTYWAGLLQHQNAATDGITQITDANYPAYTVPGSAALDGYAFVYDTLGNLRNSQLNTFGTWPTLGSIVGNPKNDVAVAVVNYYDFVMTLNSRSLCFFYDNGNYPGSPLNRNISADQDIGCSAAGSLARSDNTLLFIGSTTDSGNKVYRMNGLVPEVISNPYIDRIIDDDTLANVTAYILETNGHKFYLLNLPSTNVTLLLDLNNKEWHTWSSSIVGTPVTGVVPSLTMSGAYVNFFQTAHGYTTGQFVRISGFTNSPATVNKVVTVVDANNYYYQLGNGETTPTFGATVTVTPWIQNAFSGILFMSGNFEATTGTGQSGNFLGPNAAPYIQDANTGSVFRISDAVGTDNGAPILCQMRTEGWDGNTDENKFCSQIDVVGDTVPEQYTTVISATDDDFNTYLNFRPVDLSVVRSQVLRWGRFRRRAWFMQYFGQSYCRFYRLQMKIKKGTM